MSAPDATGNGPTEVGDAFVAALGFEPTRTDEGSGVLVDDDSGRTLDWAGDDSVPSEVQDASAGADGSNAVTDAPPSAKAASSTMSPPKGKGKGPRTFSTSDSEPADTALDAEAEVLEAAADDGAPDDDTIEYDLSADADGGLVDDPGLDLSDLEDTGPAAIGSMDDTGPQPLGQAPDEGDEARSNGARDGNGQVGLLPDADTIDPADSLDPALDTAPYDPVAIDDLPPPPVDPPPMAPPNDEVVDALPPLPDDPGPIGVDPVERPAAMAPPTEVVDRPIPAAPGGVAVDPADALGPAASATVVNGGAVADAGVPTAPPMAPPPSDPPILAPDGNGVVVGRPADHSQARPQTARGEISARLPDLLDTGFLRRTKRVRSRKVRRVVRHIDPWSVLTFSVLFHLCVFAALLLASVLVWNAAVAVGTIENIESFIRELGDYQTYEIKGDVVFRAAMVIAGILTLASSVMVVLLTVVFNLISDLVGGIRLTVVEEETVRVRRRGRNTVASDGSTR